MSQKFNPTFIALFILFMVIMSFMFRLDWNELAKLYPTKVSVHIKLSDRLKNLIIF
ncbi:hypothetical protein [Calothrix sp. PCC 7507]|uniref:hypothetical protein n=1 Tax=Calothrix sp. PCC 7507 TaxID=99598 RepID=UPI0002FE4BC9|nr:hypothetical protein [Calothrix sp. PCC 7507]